MGDGSSFVGWITAANAIADRRASGRDPLDEDSAFGRSDLVVELAEEAQPDQAIDSVAIRKIEYVDADVGERESKRREASDT
jgi:hypothetical protein